MIIIYDVNSFKVPWSEEALLTQRMRKLLYRELEKFLLLRKGQKLPAGVSLSYLVGVRSSVS